MSDKKAITLRLTKEQLDSIEGIKDATKISVMSKAISHACDNFLSMNKAIVRLEIKNEDLESEISLLKEKIKNLEEEKSIVSDKLKVLEPEQLRLT